ncbi:hypothetical protein BC827DRAFT_1262835 [Russula dissimulans]|nr:hypothetical protein BC827DRAFT_1262835 [Russula dissimulans]
MSPKLTIVLTNSDDTLWDSPKAVELDSHGHEHDENVRSDARILQGVVWTRERWWYKLAQKVILALDNEFPMLERLYVQSPAKRNASLIFPKSFRAPHLRHLKLSNLAFLIRPPLLTTAIGHVTLLLDNVSPSVSFHPNDLVHRLSQVPHLETLGIIFHPRVPHDTRHSSKPLLIGFKGPSAYWEALLPCMTAPLLAKLPVMFFNQLIFDLPHVLQFLNTAENLRFSSATPIFSEE